MLDGPVDLSHPCFEGALLTPLETLASGVADDGPATAHGTHVASVIFGQPGCEIQGIAPGCRGLILPVFESRDGSVAPCSQIDLARAITQAVDYGAHVINISGGERSPSDEPHPLLANAVRLCADNEVLIVAAAGNDGCECLHVPAAVPSVLGVGAMDAQGEPLDFSNWGTVYQAQGILAPGERVVLVVTASAHRKAALDSCAFLIDWLKTKAPFWKLEETADGGKWVDARDADDTAARRWIES
ncbi:MAG: S8 family serine peptidase [Bacteroidetes bacterium]|nr:S8 family serine peptidase [Bacteroidota bacterium]